MQSVYLAVKLTNRIQRAVFIAIVAIGIIGVFSFTPTNVSAENLPDTGTLEHLQNYCRKKLPSKLDSACGGKVIDATLIVASNLCTGKSTQNNDQYNCIINKGETYIRDAATAYKDASNASDFSSKFTAMLKTKGVSLTKLSKESQQSIKPSTSCPSGLCDGDQAIKCDKKQCDFVGKYVNPAINLLSITFGLIAVASLIIGSIQYSASSGDPQAVGKAKSRIQNTIIAIVAYFLMYAFLQFLIPGGLFNRSGGP